MGAGLQRLRQVVHLTRKLYQAELPRDRQDSPNDPEIKITGNGFLGFSVGQQSRLEARIGCVEPKVRA